jgi:hypothetical protein
MENDRTKRAGVVTVDAEEWARVSGAARSWSRLVQIVTDEYRNAKELPADDSDSPAALALARFVWISGSRPADDREEFEAWDAVITALLVERRQAEDDAR